MVKNTSGGNKTKKQRRNFGKYDATNKLEPGQMFAKIIQNNGGTFGVMCSDGISRLGKLSGEMKKGPRLTAGSYVVISLREFETEQKNCDIIAHGAPPSDVMNIFKKNDPNYSKKTDVEFVDSDDEYKDFEESKKTVGSVSINSVSMNSNSNSNSNSNPNSNSNNDDINWGDI